MPNRCAIDVGIASGNLDMIKWLHDSLLSGCASIAMEQAAKIGDLAIVKWLHENRSEGCTTKAMETNLLAVTKWLQENRTKGCTHDTMDCAVRDNGFGRMLYLHRHGHERCSEQQAKIAFTQHKFDLFLWLTENYLDQVSVESIRH
ncbi:hypothetical protein FI667_g7680, partial [Globisporangium splendens]